MQHIAAVTAADLRRWDSQIDRMIRSRQLEMRLDREDTLIAGRRHSRYTQTVNGVPIYGGDVARQTDEKGLTVSIFGDVFEEVSVATTPAIGSDRVRELVAARTGVDLGADREPRLMILPREGGAFTLVYTARVATPEDVTLFFIDAQTGAVVEQRSDAQRQISGVGVGIGVLGERKKVRMGRLFVSVVQATAASNNAYPLVLMTPGEVPALKKNSTFRPPVIVLLLARRVPRS